jgi:adenylosuccinate synthase
VLGAQWGDEGKGKLVDVLAQRFDVVARCQVRSASLPRPPWGFLPNCRAQRNTHTHALRVPHPYTPLQGGANAGHTIYDAAGKKYALHLVPSGILNAGATCVIGNGCVVHLPSLFKEIDALEQAGIKAR